MADIPLEKEVPYPGITPWLYIRAKMNQIINALGKTVPSEGYKDADVGKFLRISADKEVGLDSIDLTQFAAVDLSNCDLDTDEAGKYLKVASDGSIAYDTPGGGGGGHTTYTYTDYNDLWDALEDLEIGTIVTLRGTWTKEAGTQYEHTFDFHMADTIKSSSYIFDGVGYYDSDSGANQLAVAVSLNPSPKGISFHIGKTSQEVINANYHPSSETYYLTVYQ